MSFWLAIVNRSNWQVMKKNNICAVAKQHINAIQRLKIGDKILVYVGREITENKEIIPSQIVGAYEVSSEMYEDNSPIFTPQKYQINELFPYRVKIKPIKIFRNPINFKDYLNNFEFITNKQNYASHLQGRSIRSIPEIDYNMVMNIGNK